VKKGCRQAAFLLYPTIKNIRTMHTPNDKMNPFRTLTLLVASIVLASTAPACGKSSLAHGADEPPWKKVIAEEGYFDGPYILYEGDQAKLIRVAPGEDGAVATAEHISMDELQNSSLEVFPDDVGPDGERLKPFKVELFDYKTTDQWDFEQPENVFAISDVECSFTNTESILRAGGVIDEQYNWSYGTNHLVVNGDMFSRGHDMVALLWLLYKLDHEARQSGGMVHILLANHEAMNLRGDVRYVRPRYLEFVEAIDIPYVKLFDEHTELGRWLRTKHTIIRIGRNLFVHGGISPQFMEWDISPTEVNNIVRRDLGKQNSELDEVSAQIFGSFGPHWYRGMVHTTEDRHPVFAEGISPMQSHFDVDRFIVGHCKGENVFKLRERKVVVIDVNHTRNREEERARALKIERTDESDRLSRVKDNGEQESIEEQNP
jgi:hypothetical protein